MKHIAALFLVLLATPVIADDAEKDRTITKVIKLLQEMLEKSKEQGKMDKENFAKFKCYCDTQKAEKEKSIEDLTNQIANLEAEIQEKQGSNGDLSVEVAKLDKDMADNEMARQQAQAIRDKAHEDFIAEETDMTAAISQMDEAIEVLAAVGADQTLNKPDAMHEKFMAKEATAAAKAALVSLSGNVKKALKAASIFLKGPEKKAVTSFIETGAPFTGTYTAQSGEIVGILKNMRDTFKANLAEARAAEKAAQEAHDKFMATKKEEYDIMKEQYDTKQEKMGGNDEGLSSARENLDTAKDNLASDEDFLAKLEVICADKTKEYADRKLVRANEEAAIAQAIAILNSDVAFETFGEVDATTTGSTGPAFLQISQKSTQESAREQALKLVQDTARKLKSLRLAKLAVAMQTNPFTKLFAMIDKIIAMIDKEQKADEDQKAWCDDERTKNDEMLAEKKETITRLEGEIETLDDEINNPETGLKAILANTQESLKENRESQAVATSDRQEENAAYQKDVANTVEAQKILKKAIHVLEKFYKWLHRKQAPHHYEEKTGKDSSGAGIERMAGATTEELEEACSMNPNCAGFNSNGWLKSSIEPEEKWYDSEGSLFVKVYEEAPALAQTGDDPAPPEPFEEPVGQGGKGKDAVAMLKFILEETNKEENAAHEEEEKAQADYEDLMTDLKEKEGEFLEKIAETEKTLAEKEKTLEETRVNLDVTVKAKVAIERYLEKIKPGCDFITEYLDGRTDARKAEKEALIEAKKILKGTPAYKSAQAKDEKEALGKCAESCVGAMEHVKCKACVADSTIPAYCAGHADTPGCDAAAAGPPPAAGPAAAA